MVKKITTIGIIFWAVVVIITMAYTSYEYCEYKEDYVSYGYTMSPEPTPGVLVTCPCGSDIFYAEGEKWDLDRIRKKGVLLDTSHYGHNK